MTGINQSLSKMFRWFKDRKKGKPERKDRAEDDYGFRKRQIILQETENGHSVIIRDDETTLVYPQSFCKLHYRARMPTPVQYRETSTHIYDEIPENSVKSRLDFGQACPNNEADLIKDTRSAREPQMDFRNAIEVGPYLIVPIVSSSDSKGDVEIFKRNIDDRCPDMEPSSDAQCNCNLTECSNCLSSRLELNQAWESLQRNSEIIKDSKIVLTRCVKSKSGVQDVTNIQQVCSDDVRQRSDMCSFKKGARAQISSDMSRLFTDSPGNDSNSRTLTGTPESSNRTPDTLSERSDSCAITNVDGDICLEKDEEVKSSHDSFDNKCKVKENGDGNETNYEFDVSSGESDLSRNSEVGDYELYLSKIESNLQLKHNVRKMVQEIEIMTHGADRQREKDGNDLDSITYVSSLSEYSSAASHISDVSADRSASDDSSGYYECLEEHCESHDKKSRESRRSLERSVSAPETDPATLKSKIVNNKKSKVKEKSKTKTGNYQRSKSFDCRVYSSLSDEDKELYKFPSSSNSSASLNSRHSRNKPVLAPQPTPVYIDPYRGKSRSHNRLLGDLIRMNYDKQLLFH